MGLQCEQNGFTYFHMDFQDIDLWIHSYTDIVHHLQLPLVVNILCWCNYDIPGHQMSGYTRELLGCTVLCKVHMSALQMCCQSSSHAQIWLFRLVIWSKSWTCLNSASGLFKSLGLNWSSSWPPDWLNSCEADGYLLRLNFCVSTFFYITSFFSIISSAVLLFPVKL